MRLLCAIVIHASLLLTHVSFAQDETTPPAEGEATQSNADSTDVAQPEVKPWVAPETFDSLYEEFKTLAAKFQKDGVLATDPGIKPLREKVTIFNNDRNATERSVAVELQLVRWGRETGTIEQDVFNRLDALSPQSDGLRLMWADRLFSRNDVQKAREILEARLPDSARYPRAAVVLAQCRALMSDFEGAQAALNDIPPSASLTPALLDEIYRVRSTLIDPYLEDWRKEQALRESEAQSDDLPRVQLDTPKGPIILELFENQAPNTVANFIRLVDDGFYSGMPFKPVVTGYYVQTGNAANRAGAETVMTDGAVDWTIADELPAGEYRKHFYASLSMVTLGFTPDSGSTEFSIRMRPESTRDNRNTVFGRVLEGMDVVWKLTAEDSILSAEVVRRRDHDYTPERISKSAPAGEKAADDTESTGNADGEPSAESDLQTGDGEGDQDEH